MILFYTILLFMVMTSIFWHYELLIYMITTSILLIIANMLLYFTYHRSERSAFDRNPISLLFGWHIFLTMYLCNYTLTIFEWNGWGISEELWAVIFLTITTAIGLHFLYHYGDFSLNFAIMWGFVHVALSNGLDSLFVTVAALFLTFAIVSCYFIFKHLKAHDNLKTSVL